MAISASMINRNASGDTYRVSPITALCTSTNESGLAGSGNSRGSNLVSTSFNVLGATQIQLSARRMSVRGIGSNLPDASAAAKHSVNRK